MRKRPQFPLALVLYAPFAILIVFTVTVTSFIASRYSQASVQQITRQLRGEILTAIEHHLETLLNTPHLVTQQNAEILYDGLIDRQDPAALARFFLDQVKAHATITSLYYGNIEGGIVGAGRESSNGAFYIYHTAGLRAGEFTKYGSNPLGEFIIPQVTLPDFDARTRPWYRKALEKGRATWSDLYIVFTGQDMALAASRPVYDADHNLVGVVSVDMFLSQVQQFLAQQHNGDGSLSFILERDGNLVAASRGAVLQKGADGNQTLERVPIRSSSDSLTRAAGDFLYATVQDLNAIHSVQHLEFRLDGKLYYVSVAPLRHPYGVDWLMVIVMPEENFLAEINASKRAANVATALSALVAVVVSLIISRNILRSIEGLNRSTRRLAAGEWQEDPPRPGWVLEINQLAASFNQMAHTLRATLANLTAEIAERKEAEQARAESEERFRSLYQDSPLGLYRTSLDGKILAANPALRRMFGFPEDSSLDDEDALTRYQNPADRLEILEKLRAGVPIDNFEVPMLRRDGAVFWASLTTRVVRKPGGEIDYLDGTIEDVTERRQAREEIQQNLREKEVLLRELHHRTKNNMQVISSLLAIQAHYSGEPKVSAIFNEMGMRIRSMAMVHEKLYRSKNLASIPMRDYISELSEHLLAGYKVGPVDIRLSVEVDEIHFPVDTAIPCGLILNELISNVLKYSFKGRENGAIAVSLRCQDGGYELRVADDGAGAPAGFDFRNDGKMGLQTVFAIGENQLHGRVEFSSGPGVSCSVYFQA